MIPLPVLTAVLLFLPPLPVPRAAALVVPPVMPRAADDTSHLESPLAPDIAADLVLPHLRHISGDLAEVNSLSKLAIRAPPHGANCEDHLRRGDRICGMV